MDDPNFVVNKADFKFRPRNAVTAILPADEVAGCLTNLADVGMDVRSTDVLSGPEGAEILDSDGSNHGFRARFTRAVQMMGSSQNELTNYSVALKKGQAVVFVPVVDEQQADAIASVLARSGGERMLYFRSSAVEKLKALGSERRAQVASRP